MPIQQGGAQSVRCSIARCSGNDNRCPIRITAPVNVPSTKHTDRITMKSRAIKVVYHDIPFDYVTTEREQVRANAATLILSPGQGKCHVCSDKSQSKNPKGALAQMYSFVLRLPQVIIVNVLIYA